MKLVSKYFDNKENDEEVERRIAWEKKQYE